MKTKISLVLMFLVIGLSGCSLDIQQHPSDTQNKSLDSGNLTRSVSAAIPISTTYTTSDPTGRVMPDDNCVYVYTSSDLDQSGSWPMNQTRAFRAPNTADPASFVFQPVNDNGGVILNESQIPWVTGSPNHLWAPDCVYEFDNYWDKSYYLYFPDIINNNGTQSRIGVATASTPDAAAGYGTAGGFYPEANYIQGIGTTANSGYASDPCIFQSYPGGPSWLVYCTGDWNTTQTKGMLAMAKLNSDMKTVRSGSDKAITITGLPSKYVYLEGPYLIESYIAGKNRFYLMFSAKANDNNQQDLCYAMADDSYPPIWVPPYTFTYKGVIMPGKTGVASSNWTDHGSICMTYANGVMKYVLFYHEGDQTPANGHAGKSKACIYEG